MIKKLKLEELGRVDLSTYQKQEKHPICLVLDNIRSALNVGSAFRTADAFSIDKIILAGITPVPPHHDITKAAIGATLSVAHNYEAQIETALLQLKEEGYTLVGLEQTTGSIEMQKFNWSNKTALVVGNEVNGITEEALAHIDYFIEIPQFGTKHSLNVAVATGMALWDYMKSRLTS